MRSRKHHIHRTNQNIGTRSVNQTICYLRQDYREWYQLELPMQQLTRARCVLEETKEFSDEEIRAAVNRILFLQEVGLLKIIPQRVPPFVSSIKRYSSSFEQDLLQSPLPGMIEFGHLTVSGYETATFRSNDYAIVLSTFVGNSIIARNFSIKFLTLACMSSREMYPLWGYRCFDKGCSKNVQDFAIRESYDARVNSGHSMCQIWHGFARYLTYLTVWSKLRLLNGT